MKIVLSSVLLTLFATSAFAAAPHSGKCSAAAADAAVQFWANVPNPDANLEYAVVSSAPVSRGSSEYTVVLAFNDGNESAYGQYTVIFKDVDSCSGAKAKVKASK